MNVVLSGTHLQEFVVFAEEHNLSSVQAVKLLELMLTQGTAPAVAWQSVE